MNCSYLISVFCKHLFMHNRSTSASAAIFKPALLNKICMYDAWIIGRVQVFVRRALQWKQLSIGIIFLLSFRIGYPENLHHILLSEIPQTNTFMDAPAFSTATFTIQSASFNVSGNNNPTKPGVVIDTSIINSEVCESRAFLHRNETSYFLSVSLGL